MYKYLASVVLASIMALSGCNIPGISTNGSLASSPCGGTGTVLYGEDNRLDMYNVKNPYISLNSHSVGSMWSSWKVQDNGNGSSSLRTQRFQAAYGLSPKERFINQPIGAMCTVFLVAPDIIVTAGHCVNLFSLPDRRFVFGFRMVNENNAKVIIPNSDIYQGKELIAQKLGSDGMDYAVIRLDRPVEGVKPLNVSSGDVKKGEWLYVLGHPCGLPLKFANCAKVVDNCSNIHFKANLDTYGGNSGSPVFNSKHEVVGILVRGEEDFVNGPDGKVSRKGLHGEDCTRAKHWRGFIK